MKEFNYNEMFSFYINLLKFKKNRPYFNLDRVMEEVYGSKNFKKFKIIYDS